MPNRRSLLRRLKLRTVLVVALLLSGIIPLGVSSLVLFREARNVLANSERDNLTGEAKALSVEVNSFLAGVRRQLSQFGSSLLLAPGPEDATARLQEPWVGQQLQSLQRGNPDLLAIRVLNLNGEGLGPGNLPADVQAVMDAAFKKAQTGKDFTYGFVAQGPNRDPRVVLATPIVVKAAEGPKLILEALFRFRPLEKVSQEVAQQGVGVFLINQSGDVLWSGGGKQTAVLDKDVLKTFANKPMTLTWTKRVQIGKGERAIFAQVSDIQESGWGLVVQKPLSEAFPGIDKMIYVAILSTALLVGMSLLLSLLAARWVSLPIQRMAATTHEIAEGNFGGGVEMNGLTFELADLAEDFNRMSGHVASHVHQLRQAAQTNRELFIGSLRAFVAAIDAKDPYTRGHSERVASVSRTISRYLQLPEDVQHKVWIGALLHDVGKIGVEDSILRKEGVLAPEEYEQMKLHTVKGAEIMAPFEQLKEMIPAIRSHHEAWNGRGYPDGLKGEAIPLFARIVAVADTFDAITTNRPYQKAYNLQFAVDTITRLTGSRFDAKIVTAFLRAFEAGEIRAGATRQSRTEVTVVEAKVAGGQR
ncbi:MAG TPA: HD domain-containing phosphohydrolase [Thermoanaerobaculia bacterium]|nr:HD domain-containing phosphohydrolase [Thermoanaerobaculia bacterium]